MIRIATENTSARWPDPHAVLRRSPRQCSNQSQCRDDCTRCCQSRSSGKIERHNCKRMQRCVAPGAVGAIA
eukprot:1173522-Prymnesium_polylepis.1